VDNDDVARTIVEIDETECFRLAGTEPVGRLAWAGPRGPAIVPVNFSLEDRAIHIRTAAYSAMARECDDSRVAFEVDAYDADNRVGWSVVMTGVAHTDVVRHGTPAPDAWPLGAKAVLLSIDVESATGRRLRQR
jgi:hypothetical protein